MEDIVIDIDDCNIVIELSGDILNHMTGYIRKAFLTITPKREGVLIFIPHLFPDEYIQSLKKRNYVPE